MTCANCGYAMGPGDHFCRSCGAPRWVLVENRGLLYNSCVVWPLMAAFVVALIVLFLLLSAWFL